ncbi:MAG TPA: response regulator [Actinomycetes bacterium]|jgi:two-component system, chemotaxis family, response regulator Rcp1|nr:response regulator [Actinomycetes bacterium]
MPEDIDVLVVEDDMTYATMIRLVLAQEAEDLHVVTANTGDEAMRILRASYSSQRGDGDHRPRAVLLDLGLPDMDGTQLLARLREDPALKDVPVVVLTGSRAPDNLLRCRDLAVDEFIVKPNDLDQFIAAVQKIKGFLH